MSAEGQQQHSLPDAGKVRDSGRSARLTWSRKADMHLREELNEVALHMCASEVKVFAECAKESGLSVLWKCRELNNLLTECLKENSDDRRFAQFKGMREAELAEDAAKRDAEEESH